MVLKRTCYEAQLYGARTITLKSKAVLNKVKTLRDKTHRDIEPLQFAVFRKFHDHRQPSQRFVKRNPGRSPLKVSAGTDSEPPRATACSGEGREALCYSPALVVI